MAREAVPRAVRRQVRDRAGGRCEYGQHPASHSCAPFVCEHVRPRVKGAGHTLPELAWACPGCSSFKGPNVAGIDPRSRKVVRLFHPRRHKWSRHFRWDGPTLVGRTPIGRATIAVLNINDPEAVATRADLMAAGLYHPA
jgi:hypothetical protein